MVDLITDFLELTKHVLSPDIYRLWGAISLVAGALERRVWLSNSQGNVYPNMYVILVGPPGTGKSIVDRVRELWTDATEPGTKIPAFHVAPDSMTDASLVDALVKAKSTYVPPAGEFLTYHSLLIAQEELALLMPAYEQTFVARLNSLWNNKSVHQETRRTGSVRSVDITNPQLNMLAGTQPQWLASTFPEEAWGQGISRRLILVYAGGSQWKNIWEFRSIDHALHARVLQQLGALRGRYGELGIGQDVINKLIEWDMAQRPPRTTHSKLAAYETNRMMHTLKLCIVSAASRASPEIELQDLDRSWAWMFEVERLMPDIFRAMVGKSDRDVIEEVHVFAMQLWAKSGRKPLAGDELRRFLLDRVPHDKVESILNACLNAKYLEREAGPSDKWWPLPRREGRRADE